jgi:hypothetical protein
MAKNLSQGRADWHFNACRAFSKATAVKENVSAAEAIYAERLGTPIEDIEQQAA